MIVLCILVFIYFTFNITSIVNVFMLSIKKNVTDFICLPVASSNLP